MRIRIQAAVAAFFLGLVGLLGLAQPAYAATDRVAVLMPFDGNTWLSGEGPGQHHVIWNAWSEDLHAPVGTAVKARFVSSDGVVTLNVASVSNTCASPNNAGKNVKINAYVDGVYAGQVIYGHLNNVAVSAGDNISPDTTLGYLKNWAWSSCWQDTITDGVVHTHIEVAKGCYRSLSAWTNYSQATAIGMVAESYGSGNVSVCNENEITQVTSTHPTFNPGVTGDHGNGVLQWDLRNSNTSGGANVSFTYGMVNVHVPVVGDWDGDGDFTPGVVSDNGNGVWKWELRNSNHTGGADVVFTYGMVGVHTPIVGDWDGDGDFTPGVTGDHGNGVLQWDLRNSNTSGSADVSFTYGMVNVHTPIVGDWDGDGDFNPGVVGDNGNGVLQWDLRNSNTSGGANVVFTYGMVNVHTPIVGDWDGDGDCTPGVVSDNGNGVWKWELRNSNSTGGVNTVFTYGMAGIHTPVVGDWNG